MCSLNISTFHISSLVRHMMSHCKVFCKITCSPGDCVQWSLGEMSGLILLRDTPTLHSCTGWDVNLIPLLLWPFSLSPALGFCLRVTKMGLHQAAWVWGTPCEDRDWAHVLQTDKGCSGHNLKCPPATYTQHIHPHPQSTFIMYTHNMTHIQQSIHSTYPQHIPQPQSTSAIHP